ncbi:F-box protein CPR1-like [Silene latifolia]|uniref:F-box protein CPR1-like n=1 Tax=Silene latifolia TaxID=37657 RepID=UPI003D7711DD
MASKSTFPDDIMIEILLKLPVKSILQCNTLSKHYYSLIHSQHFVRRHLGLGRVSAKPYNQSIVSPILGSLRLFDRRGHFNVLEGIPITIQESLLNVDKHMLCGPVNGLYCVIDTKNDRFAVWNPTTRQIFNLPSVSQLCTNFMNEWDTKIAFEVDYYCHECLAYGFGYDDTSNDYKLILIYRFLACTDDNLVAPYVMFYTMNIGKGEWKTLERKVYFDGWNEIKSSVGVITCGAWHWVYECSDDSCYKILAFDILIESKKIIPFPMVGDGYKWSDMSIFSFNGRLGLVHGQRGDNMKELSSSFDVWVMDEYGVTESWTILFQVSVADVLGGRFLGIVRDRFYISEGEGWLVSYDIVSKDEERYGVLDGEVRSLLPYEESLVRIVKSD